LLFAAAVSSVAGSARSQEDDLAAVEEPADVAVEEPTFTAVGEPAEAAPVRDEVVASGAGGQWVYTQQFGWVWMAYGDAYTYAPPGGDGQPYQYVYYPAYAEWTWVVAPWVWGYGPWPYFGVYGPARFGWYGHGWWRTPGRWHYRPAPYRGPGFAGRGPGPMYRGGAGVRAAPYRGAFGARAGAPAGGIAPRAYGAPRFTSRGFTGGGFAGGARSGGSGGSARAGGGGHFGGGGHR
jgi:hypothetical protein